MKRLNFWGVLRLENIGTSPFDNCGHRRQTAEKLKATADNEYLLLEKISLCIHTSVLNLHHLYITTTNPSEITYCISQRTPPWKGNHVTLIQWQLLGSACSVPSNPHMHFHLLFLHSPFCFRRFLTEIKVSQRYLCGSNNKSCFSISIL